MKSLNNEIIVHRGETFSIDKTIQNKDGSPYIISSKLQNPAFLLTISNTRYEVDKRYIYNRYLKLDKFPRFENTTAVNLRILKNAPNGDTSLFTDFTDITELTDTDTLISEYGYDGEHYTDVVAYGYIGNDFWISRVGHDVFYVEDTTTGKKTYKYWKYDENNPNVGTWEEYECRIITPFLSTLTINWIDQNYTYSINLVDVGVDDDGNITTPFSKDIPILTPTKLTVSSNINGSFNNSIINDIQGGI